MAQEFNTSLILVATNFLETLKVSFTKKTLKQRLEANPYYPSLYSLSEVFNWYNIENKGLQIEIEQLDELPSPFLAYITIKEIGAKDFVNVTKVTSNYITYFYGKEKTVSKEDFISNWQSNIIFLAETNHSSREKDFDKNKKTVNREKNKMYLLLFGFSLYLLSGIYKYIFSSNNIISSLSFILFTIAGLAISVLLLVYEVDKSNAFVKNICTGGIKTNCDAVLGSKAGKLFGISWGEIGFFYFGFLILFLLIPEIPYSEKIPFLSYISILSAMYIPFSLFYQYKIVKQWCRLCLAIQAILFLNLSWALLFGNFAIHFNPNNNVFFIGCAILPIMLWYIVKPIIIKAKDADKFSTAYKRLYSRSDIFNLTIADQPEAPDGWKNLGGIQKGNSRAENIFLKVCSPACPHCDTAHRIFNEILLSNDNIKIITIYRITNDEYDIRRFPVKHFLALAEQDNGKYIEAMDYWYLTKERNYETLKQKFPLPEDIIEKQVDKIISMREWCINAEIEGTPTVYINGKRLPSTFNLEDLKDIFI